MTKAGDIDLYLTALLDPVQFFRDATGHEPQDWQYDYLECEQDALTLKGRQVGASSSTGTTAVRLALLKPRSTSVIVSPSLNQSKEVLERASGSLERLGIHLVADSSTMVELDNHSRIISLPGSRKSVRGWTASALLVIDEAAFLDPATFLAARAIAATSKKSGAIVRIQSTPAGPYGHFYNLWMHPDGTYAKFFVTSEEVDTISQEFLAQEKATLTPEEYAQEYLGQFGQPGAGLISLDKLEELTLKESPEPATDAWSRIDA